MKIGIDARSLQEKGIGVGRYLNDLLKYYPQIDSRNEYILYFNKDIDPQLHPSFKKRTISLPGINNNFSWMNTRLPLELAMNKVDLFHCPFYGLPFLQPCPMVVTIHDVIYEAHPEWYPKLRGMSFRMLSRWGARTARKMIAVSQHTKKDIIKYYNVDEKRIEVIYEAPDEIYKPVNDTSLLSGIRRKYGIKDRLIISVGAIHTRRNIPRLLEALKKLKQKHSGLQLLLIGSIGWPELDLPALISSMGLFDNVIHRKFVPEEDLLLLYNAAEMLVYPSLYEGFGLPLIEAMACGAPVVASNVSSIPEVVGDAGILFDPYNTDMIADSIGSVLSDGELKKKLSSRSIARAKQFSWMDAARRTIDVYEQALIHS